MYRLVYASFTPFLYCRCGAFIAYRTWVSYWFTTSYDTEEMWWRATLHLLSLKSRKKKLKEIERKFYRWFADYFIESVKLLSISKEELSKRLTIRNAEDLESCFKNGQDCAAILGHYCNWEWLSCVGISLRARERLDLFTNPLENKAIDKLFIDLRSCVGGVPVPKNEILRYLGSISQRGHKKLVWVYLWPVTSMAKHSSLATFFKPRNACFHWSRAHNAKDEQCCLLRRDEQTEARLLCLWISFDYKRPQ